MARGAMAAANRLSTDFPSPLVAQGRGAVTLFGEHSETEQGPGRAGVHLRRAAPNPPPRRAGSRTPGRVGGRVRTGGRPTGRPPAAVGGDRSPVIERLGGQSRVGGRPPRSTRRQRPARPGPPDPSSARAGSD